MKNKTTKQKSLDLPAGRKHLKRTKFETNPDLQGRIVNAIRLGLSIVDACAYAGITNETYCEWMRRAKAGDPQYIKISEILNKAILEREMSLLSNLERIARDSDNWTISAWRLERMWPEKYGRQRIEHTGANGAPIEHSFTIEWPKALKK